MSVKAVSVANSIKQTIKRQNSNQITVRVLDSDTQSDQRSVSKQFPGTSPREKKQSTLVNDFTLPSEDDESEEELYDEEMSVDLSEFSRQI